MDIITRMELPVGTAKNRALLENIFVLLPCIINHIPVVICGKPGCSKTSAVQIVISNLKGKKSQNPFLQTLPELIAVSYQGSQGCTSESVEKVFERAGKYLTAQNESSLLPVIVFDEIGLAELSPHNPLKVLHAELEVETCKYGFVGISNWRLDASKMNRALYLACADPDIEDLKSTSTVIAQSILSDSDVVRLGKSILPGMAIAYYDLFSFLKTKNQKYEYYFGLRDFYSLIKGVVNEIKKNPNSDPYTIIRQQLTIDFDGVADGYEFMWDSFCKSFDREDLIREYQPPTMKQLLDRNLCTHSDSRYLMLIAENESAIDYVERYIHAVTRRRTETVRTLVGSQMSGDMIMGHTYTETYSYRVLMDIILYAETSVTLIMRHLGHLYDNLYDMFNQNFAVSARKKYCRIALGALYHPRCLMNNDFHCIVFINQQDVEKCDPPFLNRFEKHLIKVQDLVQPEHWEMTSRLLNWLANFLPERKNDHFPLLQHLFIGYNIHHICSLIMNSSEELHSQQLICNDKTIIDLCKEKLLRVASFDFVLILALKSNNAEDYRELIQQYYNIHARANFSKVISRAKPKQIIYTYTQIYDNIPCNIETTDEIKLGNFKTESEIINRVKAHYQSESCKNLLLIRIDYRTEHEQLLSMKHILLNAINEHMQQEERYVWLVIHLQRNMLHEATNDVLFDHWSIDMIDDLNSSNLMPIDSVMNSSYAALVTRQQFSMSEYVFDEMIERCFSRFRYDEANNQMKARINQRRNKIIDCLSIQDAEFNLRRIIQETLAMLMKDICHEDKSKRYLDWRQDLFSDARTITTCRSFNDAFQTTFAHFYDNYCFLLFVHLELHGFIDSYLYFMQKSDEQMQNLWLECLNLTLQTVDRTMLDVDTIEIPLVFDLQLPCATDEYAVLKQIRRIIQRRQEQKMDLDDDQDEDTVHFLLQEIRDRSVYKNRLDDIIFHNGDLFQNYQHDQLLQFVNDCNIHLTIDFIFQLISSNPDVSKMSGLKYLLIDHEEFLQLLLIFEKASQLVGEEIIRSISMQQFFITDDTSIEESEVYYTLVFNHGRFFQLPPGNTDVSEEFQFDCSGDPFIENSIMNLIELILLPEIIADSTSIEVLSTTCSLICQGILTLSNYSVDNLEKLRSFISLIRCITSLTSNQSLTILKQVCSSGLSPMFESCQSIHQFVKNLSNIVEDEHSTADTNTIQRTVIKLEVEFLRNWLANNGDQYYEILQLINQKDNNLWRFSAKIFSYILQKLKLVELIQQHHGQIPNNDDCILLEEHLQSSNNEPDVIQRLFVDRIHMDLMLNISEDEFVVKLQKDYNYFQENMQIMTNLLSDRQARFHLQSIGLLAWLKHYVHIYAFVLSANSRLDIMYNIDRYLSNVESSLNETLKLFIVKQLTHMNNISLIEISEKLIRPQAIWLRPILNRIKQEKNERREDIIMPTPLFDGHDEFLRVTAVFSEIKDMNKVRTLINECAQNQLLMYSVYLWFIHRYCHFYFPDESIDEQLVKIVRSDLQQSLSTIFEPIGFKLIVSLCNNFNENSYFHLRPTMSKIELQHRLVALNITAFCLSMRALRNSTYLGTLLFNNQRKMPMSYVDHLQTTCLLGFIISDPVATQMIDVRTRVQERLDTKKIQRQRSFIYRCSHGCRWMYYFENCGQPNDRSRCPLCKNEIGGFGRLIVREPPQIQLTIDEGFQEITHYLETFDRQLRLGYYNNTPANQSTIVEKSDHLNRNVSFRFIHMFTNAQLLVLFELDYLLVNELQRRMNLGDQRHFHEHFEKDYELLTQSCTNPDQCYIWLYKLINHMLSPSLIKPGVLDTQVKVIEMEQLIEQNVIFPHITSFSDEINQYRVAYTEFIRERGAQSHLSDYIDELCENEQLYPLLSFFNFSRIITVNPLNEFRLTIQNLPFSDKLYPVTIFLLKRLEDYANIQYLYPIVEFTNYLLHTYNHRIRRCDAAKKTVEDCLNDAKTNQEIMRPSFEQFVHAWYQLNIKEVQFGCQTPLVERPTSQVNFARDTSLATLLLNTSKDASSILVVAYLHTLSKMQNEIINYFNNTVSNETGHFRHIPVQAIKPEHVFRFDTDELSAQLVQDGFVINFEYGKGTELIYDYEEIEMTLRNLVSNLHLLDYENLHLINYQFELYAENISLITQIRRRIHQQSLAPDERTKLVKELVNMTEDDIIHLMGSLDYVFTYLCNVDENRAGDTMKTFTEQHIVNQACFNYDVFRRPLFANVLLVRIIAFYELIEEIAFDRVLRTYVKIELHDAKLAEHDTFDQFIGQTFGKDGIPDVLKSSAVWIGTLKRLLIRVLNANVELNVPLQIYLERIDLWSNDISQDHLQSIEVQETFLLQHTFIILCEFELRERAIHGTDETTIASQNIPSIEEQRMNARTWHTTASSGSEKKTIIKKPAPAKNEKKLRIK